MPSIQSIASSRAVWPPSGENPTRKSGEGGLNVPTSERYSYHATISYRMDPWRER